MEWKNHFELHWLQWLKKSHILSLVKAWSHLLQVHQKPQKQGVLCPQVHPSSLSWDSWATRQMTVWGCHKWYVCLSSGDIIQGITWGLRRWDASVSIHLVLSPYAPYATFLAKDSSIWALVSAMLTNSNSSPFSLLQHQLPTLYWTLHLFLLL